MKSKVAAILTLNECRKCLGPLLLFFLLLLSTGCVEQTVKIIVIPARTGGGGIIGFLFLAALISAVFDRPKAITPEQSRYVDSLVRESRQSLPSVSPKINYTTTDVILAQSVAVVRSESLSPHLRFKAFSQPLNNNNAAWQQQELLDVTVEGDGSVNRRLLFHAKNNIENQKVLITWDLPSEVRQDTGRQRSKSRQPVIEKFHHEKDTTEAKKNTQHPNNKSNPDYFDPSGL